jgi:hypothetical protein
MSRDKAELISLDAGIDAMKETRAGELVIELTAALDVLPWAIDGLNAALNEEAFCDEV